ncbi:MAG: transposase [Firmicutes bacterium]|nr:transposase [Gammaproteobacteria bacterium]MCL5049013.1 transposase [Bacillota bacterium]
MPNFCRYFDAGGYFFLTVVTYQRQPVLLNPEIRGALKMALKATNQKYPFKIHAWVLLPDHFHAIIELPDALLPQRVSMIKRLTTQGSKFQSDIRLTDNERFQRRGKLWQPRYWEHRLTSERRYRILLMYCYTNPVKHRLVECVGDWPYSTFHRDVERGVIPPEWRAISFY